MEVHFLTSHVEVPVTTQNRGWGEREEEEDVKFKTRMWGRGSDIYQMLTRKYDCLKEKKE